VISTLTADASYIAYTVHIGHFLRIIRDIAISLKKRNLENDEHENP